MARTPYAAGLAGALDQTIAELERQAGATVGAPASRGGYEGKRATGAPVPSAQPPAAPLPSPIPVPITPPSQDEESGAFGAQPGAAAGAAAVPSYPAIPYAPAPAPYAPTAPTPDVIAGNLGTQIRRLEELRRWVRDDPAFGRLVDSMIGRQVQGAEKRQRVYTAVFSVVSLVVGWLLPALVPITNLHGLLPF